MLVRQLLLLRVSYRSPEIPRSADGVKASWAYKSSLPMSRRSLGVVDGARAIVVVLGQALEVEDLPSGTMHHCRAVRRLEGASPGRLKRALSGISAVTRAGRRPSHRRSGLHNVARIKVRTPRPLRHLPVPPLDRMPPHRGSWSAPKLGPKGFARQRRPLGAIHQFHPENPKPGTVVYRRNRTEGRLRRAHAVA